MEATVAKQGARQIASALDQLEALLGAWVEELESEGYADPAILGRLTAKGRGVLRRAQRLEGARGRRIEASARELLGRVRAQSEAHGSGFLDEGFALELLDGLTAHGPSGELVDALATGGDGAATSPIEIHGLRASFLLAQYGRHFAGQPLQACDDRHLAALVKRLAGIMEATTDALEGAPGAVLEVTRRLSVMTGIVVAWSEELERIRAAREPLTGRERAMAFGGVARRALRRWAALVAEVPEATVRPRLAKDLVRSLVDVRGELARAAEGELADDPDIGDDLAGLDRDIAAFRERAARIRAAREETEYDTLARLLEGEVAESVLAWAREVDGVAASERDRARMGQLCDRLFELELQIDRLVRRAHTDQRERLLAFARAQLALWERAYAA